MQYSMHALNRVNNSYNTNGPSASVVTVRNGTRVRCCVYYPQLLFEGGVYFVQELRIVRLIFECGYYLRAVTIRWRRLFEEIYGIFGARCARPTLVVKTENCLFIYLYGTYVFRIYILLYLCVMQYFHIACWFM